MNQDMDAPIFESSCSATSPKLRAGEFVEVRQRDTGLLGCWHPATLVGLKPGRRIVEYDELLSEDGLCKLRESIPSTKCMQKPSSPTPNSSPLINSSSMPSPLKEPSSSAPPVLLDTSQLDDLSENTGCSSKSACEESGSLKCSDGYGKKGSDNRKLVYESSAMQSYIETFQEPSQSSCIENSTAITSSSTLLTSKLTAFSGSPGRIEMVEREGPECAKCGKNNAEPHSVIDLHQENGEAVCETDASEAFFSKKKDCIETSLGRGEVIDPTVSQRSCPETKSPWRKVGVLLALPASLPSSSPHREEEASLCVKQVRLLHVVENAHSLAEPKSPTLLPLLPTRHPPEEWTANLCKAEMGKSSLTRGRVVDCKRGSGSQKSVEEINKSYCEKGVKVTMFPADLATSNLQGQADAMSKAKQDELGSSTGQFESGHSALPVNYVHSSTQSHTDNVQQTEEANKLDYPEERSVNWSNKYSRGRPSRYERDTKSKQSRDVSNGYQNVIASGETQEILATGHRMKRKATGEVQERVVRTGLRDKQQNHGRLFEGKTETRPENDTLMFFRNRLVLQKQANALKRKAMESRRGLNQREKNESVAIANEQSTMELKSMSSIMVLQRQTDAFKKNTVEARRGLDQGVKNEKKFSICSKRSIMEPKSMSNMTSSIVKDKTLKSLTRDIAKEALLEAGFKIDLRPRKSRDYQDSVYISPDGHAYWSLPKAWEALKKLQAEQPPHSNGQSSSEDLPLMAKIHEKAPTSSMNGEEKRRSVADADNNALKEVFSRFGNDERLQSALTKRGTCSETNSEIAQNATRQADLTNADLTDILLGDLGLLRRISAKFLSKNDFNHESSDSTTLRPAEAGILDEKCGMKRKRDSTCGLEASEQKILDGRGSTKKSQGVSFFKAREEKKQGTKRSLKQTLIETKGSAPKHKAKKGDKPKARSGLRLEARRSSSSGSEEPACHSARTVFAWMIDRGAVLDREKILFRDKGNHQAVKDGVVTREGILCSCCKRVFSVHSFEAHAGSSFGDWHQALVFTSGKRLLDRLLKAWDAEIHLRKAHNYVGISEDDTNDDTCLLCGDGGDLICCDGCPSTFHAPCLQMDNVPDGDWYCPKCSCGICGGRQRGEEKEGRSVIVCNQCEHRYHIACLHGGYSIAGKEVFCRPSCEQIFSSLRGLVGVSHSLPGGFSWSLLRCMEEDKITDLNQSSMQIDCQSKLAVALLVIKECFNPMVDPRTNIDMITHAMYNRWSDFDRLNYAGFYTAVLEKEGEIISVATIRLHGVRLAEMPLIGTREKYRRQGMCRLLVGIIEKLLASLKVAFFILPAISELFDTWTFAFGFKPLDASLKAALKDISMMVFPGTELLQKPLSASPGRDTLQYPPAES